MSILIFVRVYVCALTRSAGRKQQSWASG